MRRLFGCVCLSFLSACSGGGSERPPCNDDNDCAAGTYCAPGGCTFDCRVDLPCVGPEGVCDTSRGRCLERVDASVARDGGPPPADAGPGECEMPDHDRDGHDRTPCGGDDCDDDDANRYVGNPEICDPAGVDEDCDPTTFGIRDADGDGAPDAACCNGTTCGTDCDDGNNAVFPGATELCDGLDNDCAPPIDPGCGCVAGDTTMCGFMAPPDCSPVTGRCTTAGAFDCPPGLVVGTEGETCDGLDNNCNGAIDEGVPGIGGACYDGPGATRGVGACRDGSLACNAGALQCVGEVGPTTEVCDGQDNDCNRVIDDVPGVGGSCYTGPGGTGGVGTCHAGTLICSGGSTQCVGQATPGGEICDSQDNNCNGVADDIGGSIACNASSGSRSCYVCGNGFFADPITSGTHSCRSDCQWSSCSASALWSGPLPMLGPTGADGTLYPTTCPGATADSGGFRVDYQVHVTSCGVGYTLGWLPPGTYDVVVENYDSAVYATPYWDIRAYDWLSGGTAGTELSTTPLGGASRPFGNTAAGWQSTTIRLVVPDPCRIVVLLLAEIPHVAYPAVFIGGNTLRIASVHRL